jgi:rod shape determining protein RodA
MLRQPLHHREQSLGEKLLQVRWLFVLTLCLTTGVGIAMLYSAAGGSMQPWAIRQLVRFFVALGLMLLVAVSDLRLWLRCAYPFYIAGLLLLIVVDIAGSIGMGAQRWIDLGVINLQPSEVMKIALVLALARYFHGMASEDAGRPWRLIVPALMVLVPTALVLKQPDLGTAVMLLLAGAAVFFAAGVRLWMFAAAGVAGLAALPVAWQFLHDYQRRRVLTFLDPETDPLGSGYHILQSKIALGSGGLFGKGFMQGTQSHLNFLPEKQTDFIFTMLAEELGLVGSFGMLALYAIILAYCLAIAISAKSQFGRLLAIGITTTFFLYLFINMAMVMGLIPVVGVPLPLVSYGGTAIVSLMLGFGLVQCVHVHRHVMIGRHETGDAR